MVICKLSWFPIYCLLSGALGKLIPPAHATEPCDTRKPSANASSPGGETPLKPGVQEQLLLESQEEPLVSAGSSHDKLNNFLFRRKFINSSEVNELRSKLRV